MPKKNKEPESAKKTVNNDERSNKGYLGGWTKLSIAIPLLFCWGSFYRSQVETECPAELETLAQMVDSGLMVFRNIADPEDLKLMKEEAERYEFPVRYFCGASEYNPEECQFDDEYMREKFPTTVGNIESTLKPWKTTKISEHSNHTIGSLAGVCHLENSDNDLSMSIVGATWQTVNEAEWPSVFAGPWDRFMGMFGSQKLHYFRLWLTEKLNFPFYLGYHGWHVDGDNSVQSEIGRFHKFFVMIDKKGTNENTRMNSNIMVMPRNVREQQHNDWRWLHKLLAPVPFLRHLLNSILIDVGSCVVQLDPGDALFFREDIEHRTQNVDLYRIAMSVDIWMKTDNLRFTGYADQKRMWEKRCKVTAGKDCEKFVCRSAKRNSFVNCEVPETEKQQ